MKSDLLGVFVEVFLARGILHLRCRTKLGVAAGFEGGGTLQSTVRMGNNDPRRDVGRPGRRVRDLTRSWWSHRRGVSQGRWSSRDVSRMVGPCASPTWSARTRPRWWRTSIACVESPTIRTSGPGEFELTVADEEKFIDGLEGGRFNFMLKGVVNGEIVSLCQIASRRNRPRIRHLGEFGISVAKSHWGLGVGRAMCLAMLDVARQVGVTKVDLRVREDNVNAIRLYESLGFQREGVAARAFKIRDRYFSDLLMGMCLD
jgi:RimJ/RimL family protein N-acetyltransferase